MVSSPMIAQPPCLNHLTALSAEKTVTSARFPHTHSQIQARGKKGTLRGAKRSNADVPTIVRQVLAGPDAGDSYTRLLSHLSFERIIMRSLFSLYITRTELCRAVLHNSVDCLDPRFNDHHFPPQMIAAASQTDGNGLW